MNMIKIAVSGLTGAALDWAVAQVEGVNTIMLSPRKDEQRKPFALFGSMALSIGGDDAEYSYSPSRCWHCGGPLIDKYRASIVYSDDECDPCAWTDDTAAWSATTPLIAACRAIVAAKLGVTVEVPVGLLEETQE